ncbi:hypothetical protein D9615_006566 [Tricholomella constricta]|uniref:Uncharacterized protein n=1 Tax=Tricholomella constricta TaxID=117010 RepID=A0A8H5HA32_9AGAR|nr:hypothetical protein D9615_006566 [Tricholomella constricta]
MTTYSAFFSSGLLAPHHASFSGYGQLNADSYPDYDASSPATPSSPLPDSDIEVERDREITPTPDAPSRSMSSSSSNSSANPCTTQAPPRLRRRRSSLTVGTSPMNSIRSPTRTAGAALQLQMHLPNPTRSRSGSLSASTSQTDMYGKVGKSSNVASEGTSLVGRMRSGSVGTVLRPRRGVRRLASVPAAAPPPTAPLPAIPTLMLSPVQPWNGPYTAPLNGAFPTSPAMCFSFSTPNATMNTEVRPPLIARARSTECVPRVGQPPRGRERSFSLVGHGLTIDEEMKEN